MTKRALDGGFELDDDRNRIDIDAAHAFVVTEYWHPNRTREEMEHVVKAASRVIGLYTPGGAMVGFARVISDDVHMAWLGDVYVLPEYRGRGFGAELVREAVDNGPQHDLGWVLGTRDAHGLYEKFGFGPPPAFAMYRARTRPR